MFYILFGLVFLAVAVFQTIDRQFTYALLFLILAFQYVVIAAIEDLRKEIKKS